MSAERSRGGAKALFALIAKDLRLEWRSRARISATVSFGALTLLLFSFAAGPKPKLLAANAPGYLWLALLLASTLSLAESLRVEVQNDAVEGLRLVPVDPKVIFLAKALVNAVLLCALATVLVPLAVALYGVSVEGSLGSLALVMALGAFGIAAPGTFYAGIAAQVRSRDVVLPLLLFPILVPGLVAAVKGTSLVIEGDPMGQLGSWTSLLAAFNVLYWSISTVLFGRVIED